jgi:hypothetical protein
METNNRLIYQRLTGVIRLICRVSFDSQTCGEAGGKMASPFIGNRQTKSNTAFTSRAILGCLILETLNCLLLIVIAMVLPSYSKGIVR